MRVALFCHSLRSCWNHGNAHFLRGVVSALGHRGHDVRVFEPADSWSAQSLASERGLAALDEYRAAYPGLTSTPYMLADLDLGKALDGVDLVLVHEWSDPDLVARVGAYRRGRRDLVALFHDTHHRSVTKPDEMRRYDLSGFDGVLAFGESVRRRYLDEGWAARAWTWHEAADVRVFRPIAGEVQDDLVWIGNWGDDERARELNEFLFAPVRALGLRGGVYGVRYPKEGLAALASAGLEYRGWLANYRVPEVFGRARVTVHVPRRSYAHDLPGVPTIRMFEALACGIPVISAPWDDCERLFRPGDYLVARTGNDMQAALRYVLGHPLVARTLAVSGRSTILARHTCGHRVDELMRIYRGLAVPHRARASAAAATTEVAS